MAQRNFAEIALLLQEKDSVAVLKKPVKPGDVIHHGSLEWSITEPIAAGHKVAVRAVNEGAPVRKYGQIIGFAQKNIPAGAHVHTHNLMLKPVDRQYEFCSETKLIDYYPPERMRF